MRKLSGAALSAALLVSTFAAIPANAEISLYATNNGTASLVDITSYFTGQGTYHFQDGSYIDFTSTDVSSQTKDPAGLQLTSIDNINAHGVKGDTLQLWLSADDYTSPTGSVDLLSQLSETDSVGQANATLYGYEDNNNNLYGTSSQLPPGVFGSTLDSGLNYTTQIGVTGVPGGNTPTASYTDGPFTFTQPYSLTEVLTITFATAGAVNATFGAQLTPSAVPEPASMLLFGTVLAGVGLTMRKRFSKELSAS